VLIGPNTALALAFAGLLGIFVECLRPGRVIAGCIGIALLLWGSYALYGYGPTARGCLLLLLAAVLFGLEILFRTRFLAGLGGTTALYAGCRLLVSPPYRIHPVFALTLSLVLGLITTLLCMSARESRRNKWSDLPNNQ
jgi:membrane-bound ClpP family serine protease